MAREARETLIKDLLQANWDSTETHDETPSITFGWFNEEKAKPQVTVSQAREGPERARNATLPVDAVTPDGSGDLHQTITGVVPVHCWADHRNMGAATTPNPRQFTAAAVEEVRRVVNANQVGPTNPSTGNEPVAAIAPAEATPVPEPDHPRRAHYQVNVAFVYFDR